MNIMMTILKYKTMQQKITIKNFFHLSLISIVLTCTLMSSLNAVAQSLLQKQQIDFDKLDLIKPEPFIVRRDPSDVIKVGDYHYVYYTKMVLQEVQKRTQELGVRSTWPEGYHGNIYVAVSKDNGYNWYEVGLVIKQGKQGTFDCNSAFTPNIVFYKGQYCLFYTGVGKGFNNQGYSDNERTAIGVACSDSPLGPFIKSKNNPILKSNFDNTSFDSFRVDDASLQVHGDKIWLYYKGRPFKNIFPKHTQMGYAIADNIHGPYIKMNQGKPIQKGGHEVLVWQSPSNGFYSFVAHGHGKNSGTYRFAKNGIDFEKPQAIIGKAPRLQAPGLFRPELTSQKPTQSKRYWGVQHVRYHDKKRYISLKRFEIEIPEH